MLKQKSSRSRKKTTRIWKNREMEKQCERFERRNALVDQLAEVDLELLSDKTIRKLLALIEKDLQRPDVTRKAFVCGNA